jgi:hypothetical protein
VSFDRFGGLLGEFFFGHGLAGADEAPAFGALAGDLTLFPSQKRRLTHKRPLVGEKYIFDGSGARLRGGSADFVKMEVFL